MYVCLCMLIIYIERIYTNYYDYTFKFVINVIKYSVVLCNIKQFIHNIFFFWSVTGLLGWTYFDSSNFYIMLINILNNFGILIKQKINKKMYHLQDLNQHQVSNLGST